MGVNAVISDQVPIQHMKLVVAHYHVRCSR